MIEKYALYKAFAALRNSLEKESVRSLAKRAKVGVATAKTALDYMFSKKLLKRDIIGKMHQYTFNLENPLARQLKIAASLAEINESGLLDEIPEYPVLSAILYGSVARGDDNAKSDIDILIIMRKKTTFKLRAESKLSRELTILAYTLPEWKEKAKTDKPFYDRVISEGIALYGEKPMVI